MPKGVERKKQGKRKAQKSMLEKRAEKRAKREGRTIPGPGSGPNS